MQKRTQLVLGLVVAAGTVLLTGCASYGKKPRYTIHEAMEQGFKGKESAAARVGKGEGTQSDFKLLADLTRDLHLDTPPKGDMVSWNEKSTALASAAKALADGKPGALELWKTGANCKACHTAHKPD
jgi:hypothetical protein